MRVKLSNPGKIKLSDGSLAAKYTLQGHRA